MIRSLLVPAVLVGRWWLVPIAAVGWPLLLMANGVNTGGTWQFVLGAGALVAANVAVAVGLHRAVVRLCRELVRFLGDPVRRAGGTQADRRS
ncbi:MAG: hypothetical protein M3O23_09090 [Actinomycetota bacterium]|nr:hypothetical protein [Actinomycetota bacterium]